MTIQIKAIEKWAYKISSPRLKSQSVPIQMNSSKKHLPVVQFVSKKGLIRFCQLLKKGLFECKTENKKVVTLGAKCFNCTSSFLFFNLFKDKRTFG